MIIPAPNAESDPVTELVETIKQELARRYADQSRVDIDNFSTIIINAISNHSAQAAKLRKILWSLLSNDYTVNLRDTLTGLDTRIARAAVVMISARAHLGGDADDLLRRIIDESGVMPPHDRS